jgi:hypothetical protein
MNYYAFRCWATMPDKIAGHGYYEASNEEIANE